MRAWLMAGLALAVAAGPSPAVAKPAVRALFVGINTYLYSSTTVPDSTIRDLKGAVNDVDTIKAALAKSYGLALDTRTSASCRSGNEVSVTLTDNCATRAAILQELTGLIAASAPGDTVLFYYAGHGAQYDDQAFNQATGKNDTLVPVDARKPGAETLVEILDVEIGRLIDDANRSRGVNIVTMFDSCNSGSATRDIVVGSRGVADVHRLKPGEAPSKVPGATVNAPPLPAALPPRPASAPRNAGYRAHFAAARDGEIAHETDGHGNYTRALAEALQALPGASFDDIAADVQRRFDERGLTAQHPQAEGDLRQRLGQPATYAKVLRATAGSGGVVLAGGTLSGVTLGSAYAVYPGITEAVTDGAKPIATGVVAQVDAGSALLRLDGPAPVWPKPAVAVRETRHAFGDLRLTVGVEAANPAEAARIRAAAAALPYLTLAAPGQVPQYRLKADPPGSDVQLLGSDGRAVGSGLGPVASDSFGFGLQDAMGKLAQVQALLALRTDPGQAEAWLCLDPNPKTADPTGADYNVGRCRTKPPTDGFRMLSASTPLPSLPRCQYVAIVVQNKAAAPRYVYVLAIDPDAAIQQLLPYPAGSHDLLPPDGKLAVYPRPRTVGSYRFLTIAANDQVDLSTFLQGRVRGNEPPPPPCNAGSQLSRAICAVAVDKLDPAQPRIGAWTVTVTDAVVTPDAAGKEDGQCS